MIQEQEFITDEILDEDLKSPHPEPSSDISKFFKKPDKVAMGAKGKYQDVQNVIFRGSNKWINLDL